MTATDTARHTQNSGTVLQQTIDFEVAMENDQRLSLPLAVMNQSQKSRLLYRFFVAAVSEFSAAVDQQVKP